MYPFIWLFKRFGKQGGGKWEVVGAAYGLKDVEVLYDQDDGMDQPSGKDEISTPAEDLKSNNLEALDTIPVRSVRMEGTSEIPIRGQRIVQDELGRRVKITGYREGEWFKQWEPVIKRCAAMRLVSTSDEALKGVADGPADPREALDGY